MSGEHFGHKIELTYSRPLSAFTQPTKSTNFALERSPEGVPAAGDWFAAAADGDSEAVAHLARLGLYDNHPPVDPANLPLDNRDPLVPCTPRSEARKILPSTVIHGGTTQYTLPVSVASAGDIHLVPTPSTPSHPRHIPSQPTLQPDGVIPFMLINSTSLAQITALTNTSDTFHLSPFTAGSSYGLRVPCDPVSFSSSRSAPMLSSSESAPCHPIDSSTSTPAIATILDSEAEILRSAQLDIESLERATGDGLRAVLQQLKQGHVARMRHKYGPLPGRNTIPLWANMKGKITKRERLWHIFDRDFGGDEDKFFTFFTMEVQPSVKRTKGKKVVARLDSVQQAPQYTLRPFRHVVEAIPHLKEDLEDVSYVYPYHGSLAQAPWASTYNNKNAWEVWRALGREEYGVYRRRNHITG